MNYTPYHVHTMLSNGVTNIDSITTFQQYVDKAKECGMSAIAFSEHGSIFEWYHKKSAVEAAGMKYIHAIEAYLTESLDEKIRDNYHCVLIAKNYDGFKELNRLVSKSFNRNDNHFYYVPRISINELMNTSDNIIITSACLAGPFNKGSEFVKSQLLNFFMQNKDRCFLEIQHHNVEDQIKYNQYLYQLSNQTGLRLIAGTDTHYLNDTHRKGRSILQKAKNIYFENEEGWDLSFKTYDELVESYRVQNALPESVYLQAIENTNIIADLVQPFELDKSTKYPHIYENPEQTFRDMCYKAIDTHPYALKNHTREELVKRVSEELEVYEKTKSVEFMLLEVKMREWEKQNNIFCGPGRGSVSGSMIAYLLGITQMDSMKFDLNFFRFMNPNRVSNADIDTDYASDDRDKVKHYLLKDRMNLENIHTSEIITFNTVATKGAVRDVCRALYKDANVDYMEISNEISKMIDDGQEEQARIKYKEVFEYVDIISGTIVSIGTHPSGVLVSDLDIEETVGLCSVSTCENPVSMLNMKELDELMYVKLDILGLDNVGVINETCKLLNIDPITPDEINLEDKEVWDDIVSDTTLIFQWESNSAQAFIKKMFSDNTIEKAKQRNKNFTYLKWMSFGNGLIRPACASFRDSVANGESYDNGFEALNEFLAPEAGRIAMQETIMKFLVKFCGYSQAESDNVRRAIGKKRNTESLLPEIENRFVDFCTKEYAMTKEHCEEIIKPFMQIILDASSYGFSWNHSDAYSAVGYMCGYLRHYYPLEFFTAALNVFAEDQDKVVNIINCAKKNSVSFKRQIFGRSNWKFFYNKEEKCIYKGLSSTKFINESVANTLYDMSQKKEYKTFSEILIDCFENKVLNSRQLDVLIKTDYFSNYGNQNELLKLVNAFDQIKTKKISVEKLKSYEFANIIKTNCSNIGTNGKEKRSYDINNLLQIMFIIENEIKNKNLQNISVIDRAKNYFDFTGELYVSGKEEDRRNLYITNVTPLKNKSTGEQFGYSVFTSSIGSGKEARFTLLNNVYKTEPVKKSDIIYCIDYKKDKSYFNLTKYKILK